MCLLHLKNSARRFPHTTYTQGVPTPLIPKKDALGLSSHYIYPLVKYLLHSIPLTVWIRTA